jgi:glycosyltransferase 2 family protein
VVIVIAGSRLGPQIAHTDLGNADYKYLALAGVCLIIVLLTEAFTLVVIARALCPLASTWGVFGVAFESLLVGGATSFGGLEIPYQVVRLRYSGLSASQATSAVIVKGLIHTSLLVIVAAVALIPAIGTRLTSLQRWVLIGVIAAVLAGWLVAALWTHKPVGMRLFPRRMRKYTDSFREANLVLLHAGWKAIVGTVTLQAVYWVAMFSIIPLILMALGYKGGLFNVIIAQAALQVIMPFSPLPGGAGVAELGYLGLIGASVPSDIRVSSLLYWRIFTWLVPIAIGALAIGVRVVIAGRRRRAAQRGVAHAESL